MKYRILIVEDDADSREALLELTRTWGFDAQGAAALKYEDDLAPLLRRTASAGGVLPRTLDVSRIRGIQHYFLPCCSPFPAFRRAAPATGGEAREPADRPVRAARRVAAVTGHALPDRRLLIFVASTTMFTACARWLG